MRFLCKIGFHKWSKWQNIKVTDVWSDTTVDAQLKSCVLCNKEKIKY